MKICCVKTDKIPKDFKKSTGVFKEDFARYISNEDIIWIERSEAEGNTDYQQLIPYILLHCANGLYACYQRYGTERRLHGKWSAGIGGHIDEPDKAETLTATIQNGMFRELSEELTNFDKSKFKLHYLGIINEIESDVGQVHLGLAFIAECAEDYIPQPAEELHNMTWKSREDLKCLDKELWTELAFMLLKAW